MTIRPAKEKIMAGPIVKVDKTAKARSIRTDVMSTTPIFDIELEKTMLYSLLWSQEAQSIFYKLSEDDFYVDRHKKIFRLFKSVIEKKYKLDPYIIPAEAKEDSAFVDIMTCRELTTGWENYYRRLVEISNLRKIQDIAYKTTVQAAEKKNVKSIKNFMLSKAAEITDDSMTEQSRQTKFVDDELESIMEDSTLIAVRTGFPRLDKYCKGFLRSSFNVIASYPRAGKSTFVLNMVKHICGIQGKRVLFVSLEMDFVELHAKLVSLISGVTFDRLIFEKLSESEWQKVHQARAKIDEWKLYRMGEEETTPADIEMEIQKNEVDIIFIDYLQIMNPNNSAKTMRENIVNLSRELKQVARKTKIPIVAISSINRSYAARESKKPVLSDLKESSQIEFDAGLVLLLHRESLFREANIADGENPEEFEKLAEVLISKNRFGIDNVSIDFYFDGAIGRFAEIEKREAEEWQNKI